MRYALALVLGLTASASMLPAQVISGTLVQTGSGSPLPGGVVTLLHEDSAAPVAQLRADHLGAFSFLLPHEGAYRLRGEKRGFRAATSSVLTVGPLDTLRVEVSLGSRETVQEPEADTLGRRRLTAEAQRFYERAESSRGFGTFITRREIEEERPRRITELLRGIQGVWSTLARSGNGNTVTVRGTCRPTVFVDGVRINDYASIDDLAEPLGLEGVEVYRSPGQAPPEYAGIRAGCAVILLWTRIV